MKPLLAAVLVALMGAACDSPRAPVPTPEADAVTIQLEGVVVRQYRGSQRRFEVRAARMRVRELSESLEAEGGIQGVLDPALWKEERQ